MSGQGKTKITRRGFLIGAAALPAVATIAGCTSETENSSLLAASQEIDLEDVSPLTVPEEDLVPLSEFVQLDEAAATQEAEFSLPYGAQVFSASDTSAVVLIAGSEASPLSTASILNLETGELGEVLSGGQSSGFEIYDVAASRAAVAWSECDMLSGEWKLYGAGLSGFSLGQVYMLEEGDANWDPPQFLVEGQEVVWTMMPTEDGEYSSSSSYVKHANATASEIHDLYESQGRLACAPEASDGLLTIVPRVNTDAVYYDLLAFDTSDLQEASRITLPRSVRPLNAVYQQGKFAFSIEASYESSSAIAQMGTYYPLDDDMWLRVARTPACTPAWCNDRLVVKNGKGTAVIDLQARAYYQIAAPAYSWDFGDYLAASGTCEHVVTYSTVDPSQDVTSATVTVRVFSV